MKFEGGAGGSTVLKGKIKLSKLNYGTSKPVTTQNLFQFMHMLWFKFGLGFTKNEFNHNIPRMALYSWCLLVLNHDSSGSGLMFAWVK